MARKLKLTCPDGEAVGVKDYTFFGATASQWVRASLFTRFLDHI